MTKPTLLSKFALLIINIIILSIWSIIPISITYFTISTLSCISRISKLESLKFLSNFLIPSPFLHYLTFCYTSLEVSFFIWHTVKTHQIQKPGPSPLYGRRFLRKVFSRALSSGLNVESHLEPSRSNPEDLQEYIDNESSQDQESKSISTSELRQRKGANSLSQTSPSFGGFSPLTPLSASTNPSSNSQSFPYSNGNGPSVLSPSIISPSLAPLTPGAAKRVVRLRANSFVPDFVQSPLTKDDPRAIRFHKLQSMWFRKPYPEAIITRRDMETWLAWALYGVELKEIEKERDRKEEKKRQEVLHRQNYPTDDYFGSSPDFSPPPSPIPPTTPSFGVNPPKYSRRSRVVPSRDGLLSPKAVSASPNDDSTFSRMQRELSSSAKERNGSGDSLLFSSSNEGDGERIEVGEKDDEWETVYGNRYDFLTYCMELVEARQGFTFPTKVFHKKEIIKDGKKTVIEEEQEPIRSMRLTIDPVKVSSRPLMLYLFTNMLTYATIWKACRNGFTKEKIGRLEYLIMKPRDWTREKAEKSSKYLPIFFFHGLGIGLSQYAALVNLFLTSPLRETHPIFIPLPPQISQNIFSPDWLKPLGHHEFTDCIHKVIINEEWENCGISIISHSFGTIRHSHVLKSLGSFVKRSCFVDPVCFQLWFPAVCGNFLYFPAKHDPVKLVMRWFVGRELGTASQFRYFDWSSNILWPEDEIPNLTDPSSTRFFLAGKDAILNAPDTRNYLREHGVRDIHEGGGLYYNPDAAHGELLLHDGSAMKNIVAWLEQSTSD